jgi:hypothetical protein
MEDVVWAPRERVLNTTNSRRRSIADSRAAFSHRFANGAIDFLKCNADELCDISKQLATGMLAQGPWTALYMRALSDKLKSLPPRKLSDVAACLVVAGVAPGHAWMQQFARDTRCALPPCWGVS